MKSILLLTLLSSQLSYSSDLIIIHSSGHGESSINQEINKDYVSNAHEALKAAEEDLVRKLIAECTDQYQHQGTPAKVICLTDSNVEHSKESIGTKFVGINNKQYIAHSYNATIVGKMYCHTEPKTFGFLFKQSGENFKDCYKRIVK